MDCLSGLRSLLSSGVQRLHQKLPALLPEVTSEPQRPRGREATEEGKGTEGVSPIVLRGEEFKAWITWFALGGITG